MKNHESWNNEPARELPKPKDWESPYAKFSWRILKVGVAVIIVILLWIWWEFRH